MPKNIPSLKPKELIKLLEKAGCTFHNYCDRVENIFHRIIIYWYNVLVTIYLDSLRKYEISQSNYFR